MTQPRVITDDGEIPFRAPQSGVDPVDDAHLVTKQWAEANLGGGSGAPTDATYIVQSASGGLSAERVLVNSFAIEWDWLTSGQVAANLGAGVLPAVIGVAAGYFAPLVHVHAASDITSGVLGTARLGSGSATSASFLRGDSTWNGIAASDVTVDSSGWSGLLAGAATVQECLDRIDTAIGSP